MNLKGIDKTDKELTTLVKTSTNKKILAWKKNTNPRFDNIISKPENIIKNNATICQRLFQSAQDHGAKNIPKHMNYLVMNNFNTSCAIIKSDIFIDMVISVRGNETDIKDIGPEYLKRYLSNFEKSLDIKSSTSSPTVRS